MLCLYTALLLHLELQFVADTVVCVCACVRACVSLHVCMHACTDTGLSVCLFVCMYVCGQRSKYLVAKFIQNNLFDCWGLYFYLQQEASRN